MKKLSVCVSLFVLTASASAQDLPPEMTEKGDPVPEIITPGDGTQPPSDAIILFDGTDLSAWERVGGGEPGWTLQDGIMTVVGGTGSIHTKQWFGDVQLHIEWRTPAEVRGEGQERGNSGIYFQDQYEVQVLDSYENVTYSNGQAGAVYNQHIPLVNASRPPGVWQVYDIVFTAPVFADDGDLIRAAALTVFHNGVLVQNHVQLTGPTSPNGQPDYAPHGDLPLLLQDHKNPVSYRNIWIRKL